MAESKVEIALIANASKLKKGLKDGEKASKGFLDKIKKHQKALAIGFAASAVAIAGVVKGIRKLADAAGVQEQVEADLTAALKTQGETRRGVIQGMKDHASALQKITIYGDEEIIQMQAALATYGVTTDKMKEATEAALDFAAATGRDLKTAALTVGKAVGAGYTAELSRYGILLDTSVIPKTEIAAAVIDKLNTQFGGRAQAAANTYQGRMTQFSNAMGDLGEKVGDLFIPALTTAAEKLIPIVEKVGQWIGLLGDLHNWLMRIGEASDANAKSVMELERAIDIEGKAISRLRKQQAGWRAAADDLRISEETLKELLDEIDDKILVHVKRSRVYAERLKKVKAAQAELNVVIDETVEKARPLNLAYEQMIDNVRDLGYTIALAVDATIATKFAEAWAEAMQRVRDEMGETGDTAATLADNINQSLSDMLVRTMSDWVDATSQMFASGQNFVRSMGQATALGMVAMMKALIKMVALEITAWAIVEKTKALIKAPLSLGKTLLAIPLIMAAAAAGIGALSALEGKMKGSMPSFAMGGTVQRTGPAMVHEGEVIVNPRMPSKGQEALAMAGAGGITLNFYGPVYDGVQEVERAVARAIRGAR
jgi:hypothetical protein